MYDLVITDAPTSATERGYGIKPNMEAVGRGREQDAAGGTSEPRATAPSVHAAEEGDAAAPRPQSSRQLENAGLGSSRIDANGSPRRRPKEGEASLAHADASSLSALRENQGPQDSAKASSYLEQHRLRRGLGTEAAGKAMDQALSPPASRSGTPHERRARRGRDRREPTSGARTRADAAPPRTGWDTTPVGHTAKTCGPAAAPGAPAVGSRESRTHSPSSPFPLPWPPQAKPPPFPARRAGARPTHLLAPVATSRGSGHTAQ